MAKEACKDGNHVLVCDFEQQYYYCKKCEWWQVG